MVSLGGLTIILFGVWLYALIDAVTTERAEVRNIPKWAWIIVIVVVWPFAAIAWFFWGRPPRPRAEMAAPRTTAFPRVRPPSRAERVDDEADILMHIAERDRLLAEWADEARRREDDKSPES